MSAASDNAARPVLLEARGLNGWYGKSHILQGVDITIRDGELVALLGRNGAGKTTTMRALTGLLPRVEGRLAFAGEDVLGLPTHEIAKRGLSLVPEHRGIFGTLTVEENLALAARSGARWSIQNVYEMFPALAGRRRTPGGKLSGGEQQMLSIGRALVTGPKVLLLDEPTEGLAPVIVDRLVDLIRDLKASGLSMLLVEQNLDVCMAVADRLLIIDGGTIVWEGSGAELAAAEEVRGRHLTLEHA
ncbi:ABC transporter ATP-binding protein [Enterovirga rhinocerotis]|uniref:Amino acid/amide ABC transporter ATP-binding protein 2 (HAAT family) n=1 Tax=Enterovirga rhinocerotis TaxID=1339210 RepID=A0A4R7BV66_9HYPH|nr:ABC transporter ATP-binding protein [Enterovirga rhinocerotis]TDR89714.1 amino acid/amide ABC transporter ATP-binding protein 2 (HAAT family) [Enterovirga rhinocerotis]